MKECKNCGIEITAQINGCCSEHCVEIHEIKNEIATMRRSRELENRCAVKRGRTLEAERDAAYRESRLLTVRVKQLEADMVQYVSTSNAAKKYQDDLVANDVVRLKKIIEQYRKDLGGARTALKAISEMKCSGGNWACGGGDMAASYADDALGNSDGEKK